MTFTVYVHTNKINGKKYVGITSKKPQKRWNNGKGYKNQPKIWSDIKESDWNTDWVHEILCENASNREEAEYLESLFISWFDSINKGYNTSEYGSFSCKHSEESKNRISKSKGVNGILQFTKDGELIAEYPSLMEAERQTGCNNGNICACCKGRLKSCGGYIWEYKKI